MTETFEIAACIGIEENMSLKKLERFINFMDLRFPGETNEDYIREWAQRFKNGIEFFAADRESKMVLNILDKELNIII